MPMVEVNGIPLHYDRVGRGVPIVFIHPPLLTGENFVYQQEQLADRFEVITFDIRGHGRSGYSKEKVTYPLIADDICKLMDQLNIPKAYLCGYSTGGSVALETLLRYQDRFLGGILISGMSEVSDWYNRSRIWTAARITRLRAKRLMTAAIAIGNSDMPATFKRLYASAIQGHVRNLHQYYEYSYNYSCTSSLHRIHIPMLLIYGEKDVSFHRYAHLLHRSLPNSTLHLIAGAYHQIPTKNASALHELMRLWLADAVSSEEATSSVAASASASVSSTRAAATTILGEQGEYPVADIPIGTHAEEVTHAPADRIAQAPADPESGEQRL